MNVEQLPASRYEHRIDLPDTTAGQVERLTSRATLAAVCQAWGVAIEDMYLDRRHPLQRQARAALALFLWERLDWTRPQIMHFNGRRSTTYAWGMLKRARESRQSDTVFAQLYSLAEQQIDDAIEQLAALIDLDEDDA